MKSMLKGLVVTLMLATGMVTNASEDIQVFTADNSSGKITAASIEKAFKDTGFKVSGNNNMNAAYKSKTWKTHHKVYHLFTTYRSDLVLELVKISPRAALLAPLSMSFYTKAGLNDITMSTISLDGMAKVTGIPADNKHMVKYAKLVKEALAKALPGGKFEKTPYESVKPTADLVTSFSFEMEATTEDEIEEELEGVQTEMEGTLETMGFVMAGFNKLGDEFKAAGYDKYDFFDAYSICKLPVIYTVGQKRPEAGAFAPCTFYMYKEKGNSDVIMEFPSVYNWLSSLAIEDKESFDVLISAQKTMTDSISETVE